MGLGEPCFPEGKPHCVELETRNKLEVTPAQAGLVPKCMSHPQYLGKHGAARDMAGTGAGPQPRREEGPCVRLRWAAGGAGFQGAGCLLQGDLSQNPAVGNQAQGPESLPWSVLTAAG